MLSKKMYAILSCFPRSISSTILFEDVLKRCGLSGGEALEFLSEACRSNREYILCSYGLNNGSELSLTEDGLGKVEEYEDAKRNRRLVWASLATAIAAMIASVASAVAAFLTICG